MNKYNLDKLVKVECNDFYPAVYYTYRKEKRFLGFKTQKEGIYTAVFNAYIGIKPPEHYTIKNGVLYDDPEVILHYQGGHKKIYYFNSYNEALKFANEITLIGRWQS